MVCKKRIKHLNGKILFYFRHEHLSFYLEQTLALLHLHHSEEVAKV